jgi:hypothetical protein
MRAKTKYMDRAGVAVFISTAAISVACGSARNEEAPNGPSLTAAPGEASAGGSGAIVSGGMDSGGTTVAPQGNTSSDGVVTTSIWDLTNVRSRTPLTHIFQPAEAGVPEKLFLRHYLKTPTGQVVAFEFDYVDGLRSFPVSENGFLAFTRNGTELLAKAGNVTIEPMDNGTLKVSFDNIAVAEADDDLASPAALETIGSGWVHGTTRRSCLDGGDEPEVEGGEGGMPAPAIAQHDPAWVAAFCGN